MLTYCHWFRRWKVAKFETQNLDCLSCYIFHSTTHILESGCQAIRFQALARVGRFSEKLRCNLGLGLGFASLLSLFDDRCDSGDRCHPPPPWHNDSSTSHWAISWSREDPGSSGTTLSPSYTPAMRTRSSPCWTSRNRPLPYRE